VSLYEYRALVKSWVDADTIDLDVDLGFRHWIHDERFRLVGINAPDKQPAKREATAIANRLCPAGFYVTIRTEKNLHDVDKQEKYGRWLATVIAGQRNINDLLVQAGAAVPWDGTGQRPETAA
jgi:micrococcal nuclease